MQWLLPEKDKDEYGHQQAVYKGMWNTCACQNLSVFEQCELIDEVVVVVTTMTYSFANKI